MKKIRPILIAIALIGGVPQSVYAQSPGRLDAAQIAAIDRLGQKSVSGGFTPSVVIGVERDGKTIYARGFGARDVITKMPAQPLTKYMIGSNTKQFTAASILLLQDEGKLSVDDRISKYFPAISHANEVTLRELLTMSSGYADYVESAAFLQATRRPALSPAEPVAMVRSLPLDFRPGTSWSYCNTGYMLAQMVIERVSGMTYRDFLQRHFFTPLGMDATYLQGSGALASDIAAEYTSFALGRWEAAPFWDYTWIGGAGGIVSDMADLEKWNAALDGGKILSARSLAEMLAPGPGASSPGGDGYGMGIRVGKMPNGHSFIAHGGNTTGSSTQDLRFPDDHLSIIVLSNAPDYSFNATAIAVYGILVPQPPLTKAAQEVPAAPGGDPKRVRAAIQWLNDAIAGHADASNVTDDMRALLTRAHRRALTKLARYGPRTFELAGIDRRKPTTMYAFTVKTTKTSLLYSYKWNDDGKLANVQVLPVLEFGQ